MNARDNKSANNLLRIIPDALLQLRGVDGVSAWLMGSRRG